MERRTTLWTTLAVVLWGAGVAVVTTLPGPSRDYHSAQAIVAYVCFAAGVIGMLAAARGWRFPFADESTTQPHISVDHRIQLRQILEACRAALASGAHLTWGPPGSIPRAGVAAHHPVAAAKLADWEQALLRKDSAQVTLRERFEDEVRRLDLADRYDRAEIVDAFTAVTINRAASGQLTQKLPDDFWGIVGPVPHGPPDGVHIGRRRAIAISLERVPAATYRDDAERLIAPVRALIEAGQQWTQASAVAEACTEVEAFARDEVIQEIAAVNARENLSASESCPVCGDPVKHARRRRRRRISVLSLGVIVVIAATAVGATSLGRRDRRTRKPPAGLHLSFPAGSRGSATLVASVTGNDPYDGARFTNIVNYYATEPLEIRVRVENVSSVATAPLDIVLLCQGFKTCGEGPLLVTFTREGTDVTSLTGLRLGFVAAHANGDGRFEPGLAMVYGGDSHSPFAILQPVTTPKLSLATPGYIVAGSYALGTLPARATRTALIQGRFALTTFTSGLGGGSITIEFRPLTATANAWSSTGVAAPGQRLEFRILLNDTGFQPVPVHLRVRISPKDAAQRVILSVIVPHSGFPGGVLGSASVRSETGSPISLSVIPNTTEELEAKTKCSQEGVLAHLANGIQTTGLFLGDIGGYQPRDPCGGAEFTRYVNFDAEVR